jgi:ABC-type nitrate/sulfonate/bicarbonate transport system permease component
MTVTAGPSVRPGPALPDVLRSVLYRALRAGVTGVVSLAVICLLWAGAIRGLHLNPYFAKTPLAVWRYLVSGPGAAANRQSLVAPVEATLRDASLGYLFGTLAGLGVAIVFVLSRSVEQSFMPIAVALRSVPLVAMTPLLVLVFGRGLLGVTVIAGIVTFFPTLVNVNQGLRSAPPESLALMSAYNAGPWTTLRRVRLPYALPSLFASARIAGPGAILGATLAEWLATGKGLGALMSTAASTSEYNTLWSAVVIVTGVSFLLYALVGVLETPALYRLGTTARR